MNTKEKLAYNKAHLLPVDNSKPYGWKGVRKTYAQYKRQCKEYKHISMTFGEWKRMLRIRCPYDAHNHLPTWLK